MKKTPYTLGLLLPTISPAAKITIYEDERVQKVLYRGIAIKAADAGLNETIVKHVGVNEMQSEETAGRMIEIFVYGAGQNAGN